MVTRWENKNALNRLVQWGIVSQLVRFSGLANTVPTLGNLFSKKIRLFIDNTPRRI
jgi:hypothetical protein